MLNNPWLFLWPFLGASVVMTILWAVQLKTRNAGTVDVAWAIITPLAACWMIVMDTTPDSIRQYLVMVLALFWGFRLGLYLLKRVIKENEDGRYRHFREYAGNHAVLIMFLFFQAQAFWTLLFALPFWAAAQHTSPGLLFTDYLGLTIWLVSIWGEILSDKQLAGFRSNPENMGKVCNRGLWKYSRHPNYFFEWMHWFAYVSIGFYTSYWWLTVAGTLVMYIFITRITGIPYTEKQAVRSRGRAYIEYQKTTSAFFPVPKKGECNQITWRM